MDDQVLEAWKKTHYRRHRLALYLRRHGLSLSPHTIRHIHLLHAKDTNRFLSLALHRVDFYNANRLHFGKGMTEEPPFQVLHNLGHNWPTTVAIVPTIMLDEISADLLLACHKRRR
ncbi:MAG: hypothetical protein GTN93_12785 [Anaerolineae bacterium]|nr:hypothetical protein [Anaerolineae bacterium]